MNETIPERCPLCSDLKNWKHRSKFENVTNGEEYGYTLCELRPSRAAKRDAPSRWIFDRMYCFDGKYVVCPLFSEWFWKQIIKNNKVKVNEFKKIDRDKPFESVEEVEEYLNMLRDAERKTAERERAKLKERRG